MFTIICFIACCSKLSQKSCHVRLHLPSEQCTTYSSTHRHLSHIAKQNTMKKWTCSVLEWSCLSCSCTNWRIMHCSAGTRWQIWSHMLRASVWMVTGMWFVLCCCFVVPCMDHHCYYFHHYCQHHPINLTIPTMSTQCYPQCPHNGIITPRPEIPERIPPPLREIISGCWAQDPGACSGCDDQWLCVHVQHCAICIHSIPCIHWHAHCGPCACMCCCSHPFWYPPHTPPYTHHTHLRTPPQTSDRPWVMW